MKATKVNQPTNELQHKQLCVECNKLLSAAYGLHNSASGYGDIWTCSSKCEKLYVARKGVQHANTHRRER